MGRGGDGRGRQDKTDWLQGVRQPSLHIPFTRVMFRGARVANFAIAFEITYETMAPLRVCAR